MRRLSIPGPGSAAPRPRGGETFSGTGPAAVSVPEFDAGAVDFSANDRLRWQRRAARVLTGLLEMASRAGLPPIVWYAQHLRWGRLSDHGQFASAHAGGCLR